MTTKVDECITGANHIGLGFKTVEQVEALKKALVDRGATIVREAPDEHKYFLKLDERDGLLVEIFVDKEEGPSIHFDFNVTGLDGLQATHPRGLLDYGIPNMLFLDVPGMPYEHPLLVQLAFGVRSKS